uniref:Uncharacterized protein n=1 Tax=Oryza sativa subsp. japonica TaxID=39947 RepID=Q6H827_ORYSJ|nr:hypothetical protein [Oryza sativa Japonica Group]
MQEGDLARASRATSFASWARGYSADTKGPMSYPVLPFVSAFFAATSMVAVRGGQKARARELGSGLARARKARLGSKRKRAEPELPPELVCKLSRARASSQAARRPATLDPSAVAAPPLYPAPPSASLSCATRVPDSTVDAVHHLAETPTDRRQFTQRRA